MPRDTRDRDAMLAAAMKLRPVLVAHIAAVVSDFAVAEDILQEVIVEISNRWQEYNPSGPLRVWCLDIARQQALAWIQTQRGARPVLDTEALAALATDPTWHNTPGPGMLPPDALRDCVGRLTHEARVILELSYGQGQSCKQIAEDCERTIESIYVALTRIRDHVRKCVMRAQGMESI